MKTYQVEIKETLCMTVEIEAENAQQAEAIVQKAYNNEEYILDSEHFAGVEFVARKKKSKHGAGTKSAASMNADQDFLFGW